MSSNTNQQQPSRRAFLRGSLAASGGLVLGLSFGRPLRAAVLGTQGDLPADFAPNAFLRILSDGSIQVLAKHDEMGQGIHTGLAIAVCEELEVDVSQVEVVPAPADTTYNHSVYGAQVTGGSTSTWSSFDQMRQAGAVAREMLVSAAAARFGVERSVCEAVNGSVRTKDGTQTATYGELAEGAARVTPKIEVPLKDPSSFTRIGKPTPRVDSPAKVRGQAVFAMDRRPEGRLTAVIARSPYFGGKLESFDASEALKVDGVKCAFEVPSGVAVVATNYFAATKGRDALQCEWDAGPGGAMDSDALRKEYLELAKKPGNVARDDGDVDAALSSAESTLEAIYEVPFMAHCPMEPLNCTVQLRDGGGAKVWTGSQMLGGDHPAVAARLGVDLDKVEFENSFLGGGFGRRANPKADYTLEAVEVALAARNADGLSAAERKAPFHVVWSREDDLRGGFYRPMFVNAIQVGMKAGKITGWAHRIVGQSIATGTAFEGAMVIDGIDGTSVEGAADMPHGIPNLRVDLQSPRLPIPVQWWRSVGHSNTAFAKESMLDECAEKLGRDPFEMRRELLADHPRWKKVLEVAAEKANWGAPLPEGVGRGISVHESFRGFAAHVVEASIVGRRPKVHRIVCAIDCGLVINPDQVEAQMQGAANFALSSAIDAEISLKDGRVVQSNFHDFPIVRMHEAPKIEVHIVKSDDEMGGIGEVGVPGVASALCSALRMVGGPRIRRLPIADQLR